MGFLVDAVQTNHSFSSIAVRTTSSTERLLDPAPGNGPGHVAQPARDGRADVRGAVRLSRHARHVHHLHPAAHPRVRRQQRRQGFSHSSAQERRAAQQRRTDEAAALRDPSEVSWILARLRWKI